ncbi:MAG TPA: AgmX/PglI C-terminal domain-containing protein [Kofleriaceae bacterium]|nr:AgmX/PglI C-terminal domain-containing protein [Kofleriaceae bacterium]
MRSLAVGVAVILASCAPGDDTRPLIQQVPRVEVARALAADALPAPPRIVFLDGLGIVRVANAPTGARLATLGATRIAGTRTTLDALRHDRFERDHAGPEIEIADRRQPAGSTPTASELPRRLGQVVGAIVDEAGQEAQVLVVAAPTARASALVDVLTAAGGIVGVAHRGTLRALKIDFGLFEGRVGSGDAWIEVRVGRAGVEIENVPDLPEHLPWVSGTVDGDGLERAVVAARQRRGLVRRVDVDVLVSPEVSAQRLVDVLVRLETAGVRVVVLGHAPAPGSDEAARRGQKLVLVLMGQPQSVGDLDKAIIRRVVKERVPELRACYDQALARDANVSGTINTQFFIAPSGNVSASNASGVKPELAACFARVLGATVFPKPKGGGGVQVNYPFRVRS